MEAEKSYDLLPTRWRSEKLVILFQGLRVGKSVMWFPVQVLPRVLLLLDLFISFTSVSIRITRRNRLMASCKIRKNAKWPSVYQKVRGYSKVQRSGAHCRV